MNAPTPQNTRFTRHGSVRVAPGGTFLQHADGTPFFYLADTAWSGALRSTESEWAEYLADRAGKGFTAIQFVMTAPWLGAPADAEWRRSFDCDDALGPPAYTVNEEAFARMDDRIRAINEAGLLAVPVLAWAAHPSDPGRALPTRFLAELLEFEVRRYSSRDVLWLLAGDGRYGLWRSWRWKTVARRVFAVAGHAPVALHPQGLTWPYRSFRREPWLDVIGYQSSHSDSPKTLRWLLAGPPARQWQTLRKPFINIEPSYEGIRNWDGTTPFTNRDVRRAMYASLLNAPTAGVTYGAHGIWSWQREAGTPINHFGTGIARPWREALQFPGSHDVQRLASLFTSLEWWRLRPTPNLLAAQPAPGDWSRFVSCAATDSLDLALCYLAGGGAVTLTRKPARAEWFDPGSGSRMPAPATLTLTAPSEDDWVLLLRDSD